MTFFAMMTFIRVMRPVTKTWCSYWGVWLLRVFGVIGVRGVSATYLFHVVLGVLYAYFGWAVTSFSGRRDL